MNAVTKILSRIKSVIPVRGTLMTPSGTETYPIAICNEIMGGPFIVDSIDELKQIPINRLLKGCKCTVNEHMSEGVTVPTTTYLLKSIPETQLDQIPNVNISDYWILDLPRQKEESAVEYQYAPNYNGLKPPFLSTVISRDAYNAGYGSNEDYATGDTGLKIWKQEYDSTADKWIRQKTANLTDWGIPVSIDESYEEGTYNDVRFLWRDKTIGMPATPASKINGVLNNEPTGWLDTPEISGGVDYNIYILTNNLWRISAIKNVYGDIQTEWSIPLLVSTDPTLVRYGTDPNNSDYLNDTYWRGFYSIGDTYKASRVSVESPWTVEAISGESGEYLDYVFKAFQDSYEPIEADAPKTILGYGSDGWKDGVFTADPGYTLYTSTARKFSNGEIKSWWTTPVRFDGKNTIRAVIVPDGSSGTLFKYSQNAGTKVVVPSTIVLKSKVYDASTELSETAYTTKWYIGTVTNENEIFIGSPNKPVISGVGNNTLTISPSHVNTKLVLIARTFLQGEDYIDDITILDVTDGSGYVPVMQSNSGYIYKGAETKVFTGSLYENGIDISTNGQVSYVWSLNGTQVSTSRNVNVSDSQVSGVTTLKLSVQFLGQTYEVIESLVDVEDGKSIIRQYSPLEILVNMSFTPETPDNPNQWSLDSTNVVWVIEKITGGAWNVPYRVKGEKGTTSGAFQKIIYRTYDPANPPTSDWRFAVPTSKTDPNSNLVPTGWSESPDSTAPQGSTIYGAKATFSKTQEEGTTELVKNWSITGSGWTLPFRVTYFAADGEGVKGDPGFNGWTPVISIVNTSFGKVQKVTNWIGGGGTKPPVPQYVGANGFVVNAEDAVNVQGPQGPQGPTGENGVFLPENYWNPGTGWIDGGNNGYEFWMIKMRVSKVKELHYEIRSYSYRSGYREIYIQLPPNILSSISTVLNPVLGYHVPNPGYALVFPTIVTNSGFIRQMWGDESNCFGIKTDGSMVITFNGGLHKMAHGVIPIL